MGAPLQFFLSALVIVVSGVFITKCADEISEKTGLGQLLIGSILLAAGTSMPELLVDLSAVRGGMSDLAASELIGTSLINILILAVGDYFDPGKEKVFSYKASRHAITGTLSILLTSLVAILILLGEKIEHINFVEVGIGPFIILLFYFAGVRLTYKDQQVRNGMSHLNLFQRKKNLKHLIKPISGFIASVIAIAVVSPYLAEAAGLIAEQTGLGETFIGATLVAASTSLPELVITISAIRMKAFDLAIGNIFGSNCFNMVIFAPLDIAHKGSFFAAVSKTHVLTCLSIIMATSITILGQLYHVEKRVFFIEPDATSVLVIILGTFGLLYYLS